MFGNNDIANELKIISNEINALRHEVAFVKEQQIKELELLNKILEGLRVVYSTEKEGFSDIKASVTSLSKTTSVAVATNHSRDVGTRPSHVSYTPASAQASNMVSETLTEKFNRVINGITSLKDMPEEFNSIGLKSDGNKLVPVSGIESHFIVKNKDDEYDLYPSVQVKNRRGQETTEGEFDYTVNGASMITVKKPCRLLKFEYGYKVLEKGSVQID